MAVNIGATTACLTVQAELDSIAGANNTSKRITNHGMLQAIKSSTNTSGFTVLPNQSPQGRVRTVNIQYVVNPRTAAGTGDDYPDICTPGTTDSLNYASVNIDHHTTVELTLTESEFRTFCLPYTDGIKDSTFTSDLIQMRLNQLFDQVDQDAVTYASVNAGQFYDGIAGPKTVTLIKSDGSPYYGGEVTVAQDMDDAGVTGMVLAVGKNHLDTYSRLSDVVCCDNTGIDMSKAATSTWGYFSDRKVDETVAGTGNAFIMQPGALQMVNTVNWIGDFEQMRSQYEIKTNMNLPIPGADTTLPVDFTVFNPFCSPTDSTVGDGQASWVMRWTAHYSFWNTPTDLENVGSPYRAVNGIYHYQFECGDVTCADVPS